MGQTKKVLKEKKLGGIKVKVWFTIPPIGEEKLRQTVSIATLAIWEF